jgi:hypothetical protein
LEQRSRRGQQQRQPDADHHSHQQHVALQGHQQHTWLHQPV